MRIFVLANNWLGWQSLLYLKAHHRNIVGLAIHPGPGRAFGPEILSTSALGPERIFDGATLDSPDQVKRISALQPDIGVSVLFDYILRPPFIDLFPRGIVNLHPSYLPYNRGQYPNVWSIVDQTPAGVTLHYIDQGVDTGDIIAQRKVPVRATDTGESLYRRLEREGLDLFRETWPSIERGEVVRKPQRPLEGTIHRRRDVEDIDRIDLDASYEARHLLNILRARTFPPYGGAYFIHEGERIHVRVQLIPDGEIEGSSKGKPDSPRR